MYALQKPSADPQEFSASCYDLPPASTPQLTLFDEQHDKTRKVADAMDKMNNQYGEVVITPAIMMGMEELVIDQVACSSVKGIEDLYAMDYY